jgi:hypothetical protein
MTRRIEVVIDELVLRGFSPEDARRTASALESQLTKLASAAEHAPRGRDEAYRRVPPVRADSPSAAGEAVAGAVWSEVAR